MGGGEACQRKFIRHRVRSWWLRHYEQLRERNRPAILSAEGSTPFDPLLTASQHDAVLQLAIILSGLCTVSILQDGDMVGILVTNLES